MARAAKQERRGFVPWAVLSSNAPAIEMYKALNADFLDGWRSVLLAGDGLQKLSERDS